MAKPYIYCNHVLKKPKTKQNIEYIVECRSLLLKNVYCNVYNYVAVCLCSKQDEGVEGWDFL